ncbi:hypothetical protein EVAR_77528_1 [Eumeta japonica]|uniref:Uncharacterized protein n=1 Tax=Eumeta variegata TaxID=151549 RepID=A0A4C1T9L0_EUMVA|nr:hypothetical protein EVAR_77528_1 [Eumeta japonica]
MGDSDLECVMLVRCGSGAASAVGVDWYQRLFPRRVCFDSIQLMIRRSLTQIRLLSIASGSSDYCTVAVDISLRCRNVVDVANKHLNGRINTRTDRGGSSYGRTEETNSEGKLGSPVEENSAFRDEEEDIWTKRSENDRGGEVEQRAESEASERAIGEASGARANGAASGAKVARGERQAER